MTIEFISDIGKIREKNEDSFKIIEDDNFIILAVADGMGGHSGGDRASEIAAKTIKDIFEDKNIFLNSNKIDEIELIKMIFKKSNEKIYTTSNEVEQYEGMGTTLTLGIINKNTNDIYIGNVGDSRCYLIDTKNNKIKRITKDHSLVEEMLNNNEISKEEAFNHPQKNIITRALGTDKKVQVDIYNIKLKEENIIIICTDGLTNHLKDIEIKNIVKEHREKSLNKLIKEVNYRGGCDNTTIILYIVEKEVQNG